MGIGDLEMEDLGSGIGDLGMGAWQVGIEDLEMRIGVLAGDCREGFGCTAEVLQAFQNWFYRSQELQPALCHSQGEIHVFLAGRE